MAATVFRNDDAGYIAWRDDHPAAYILNTRNPPTRDVRINVLHLATCSAINASKNGEARWTSGAYQKACFDDFGDVAPYLASILTDADPITIRPCLTCCGSIELSDVAIPVDHSVFRVTWVDGPSKGWSDLIPARWIVDGNEWANLAHVVTSPEGERFEVRCSGKVGPNFAVIDYGRENASGHRHKHFIGTMTLTYREVGRRLIFDPIAEWAAESASASIMEPVDIVLVADPLDQIAVFDPYSLQDGRRWVKQMVALRQGQGKFRQDLLRAYNRRCAITGCDIEDILEAAHIVPYAHAGVETNAVANGILLRADIHTLFDLGIIRIAPDYTIKTSDKVRKSLDIPNALSDANLPELSAHRPSQAALEWKFSA